MAIGFLGGLRLILRCVNGCFRLLPSESRLCLAYRILYFVGDAPKRGQGFIPGAGGGQGKRSSPFRLVEEPPLGEFVLLVPVEIEMPGDGRAVRAIGPYGEDGDQGDNAHGKADKDPFHAL